jgi:hypothetical protein
MQFDYQRAVQEALTVPGKISAAYSSFWSYSLGNQMLAMWQLGKAEPISTFPGWKRIGRNVKKGKTAIALVMPVTGRKIDEESGEEQRRMFFVARKNWFGLSQTEGTEYVPEPIPDFDLARALAKLEITQSLSTSWTATHKAMRFRASASWRSALSPSTQPRQELTRQLTSSCTATRASSSTPTDQSAVRARSRRN